MICQNCQYLHILSKSIRFAKIHTICQNQQVSQNPHDLSKSTGNCLNPQGFWKICTIDKIRNNCQIPQVFSKSSQFAKVRMNCQNLPGFWKIRNLPKSARFSKICTIFQNLHTQNQHVFTKIAQFAKIGRVFAQNPQGFSKICTICPNLFLKDYHSAWFTKIRTFCQNQHNLPKSAWFLFSQLFWKCKNVHELSKSTGFYKKSHNLSKSAQIVKIRTICQNLQGFWKICTIFEKLHDLPKSTWFTKIRKIYQNPHWNSELMDPQTLRLSLIKRCRYLVAHCKRVDWRRGSSPDKGRWSMIPQGEKFICPIVHPSVCYPSDTPPLVLGVQSSILSSALNLTSSVSSLQPSSLRAWMTWPSE